MSWLKLCFLDVYNFQISLIIAVSPFSFVWYMFLIVVEKIAFFFKFQTSIYLLLLRRYF